MSASADIASGTCAEAPIDHHQSVGLHAVAAAVAAVAACTDPIDLRQAVGPQVSDRGGSPDQRTDGQGPVDWYWVVESEVEALDQDPVSARSPHPSEASPLLGVQPVPLRFPNQPSAHEAPLPI